jgi:LEA14-like dessication related protein
MNKKKTLLFVLTAAILTICGCATLVDQQLVDRPVVTFEGMSLENVSLFESKPVFSFKVKNPNPMGINIKNIAYNFKLNDRKFIRGVTDKSIRLKPVTAETLSLAITFNYSDLFESSAELSQRDKVEYDLSGAIRVGPFAVPYRTRGTIQVPILPQISLKQVDISNFSMTETSSMIFVLYLENPNAFPIQLDALNYDIRVGGKNFAKGRANKLFIDKNGNLNLEIPVSAKFYEMNWSLDNMLTGSSAEYELTGEMIFYSSGTGRKHFPFYETGKTPVRNL